MANSTTTDAGHYRCALCSKRYKRQEHLQRHQSSHSSDRPYKCSACDSTFQRTDVLKRHLRTCRGKNNAGPSKSTTKRSACDRCVRVKKACDSLLPCQRCLARAVECRFSVTSSFEAETKDPELIDFIGMEQTQTNSMSDLASLITMRWPTPMLREPQIHDLARSPFETSSCFDFSNLDWQHLPIMTSQEGGASFSLHFLNRFTSNTGFIRSFDCGNEEQRKEVAASASKFPDALHELQETTLSSFSLPPELQFEGISDFTSWGNASVPRFGEETSSLRWLHDPHALKTHEILVLIREVVTIKPRNSVVTLDWSPDLESQCLQFFSPSTLQKFIELYWAIWHPNVNFVHRPTFHFTSAKSTLLATMALIGACVSPDIKDNEDAKLWFNCVEEVVFIDDDFNSDMMYPSLNQNSITAYRSKVQALQAAYMVCLYQNWEGDDASKRRIRRYRFTTLVSTARDMGISIAKHKTYSEKPRYAFDWKEFAVREELIRVLVWIFLLDTAFVIFNNIPPRVVIKEMKIHMAVPEVCFQAPTADQCYQQIQLYLPPHSPYWRTSLCRAFKSLCRDNLTADTKRHLAAQGPLNLFALTSAIHSLIFQQRNLWESSSQPLLSIRNALDNWREVWQIFAASLLNEHDNMSPHITVNSANMQPQTMWKRIGFYGYCPEYWLLANLMADRLTTEQPTSLTEDEIDQLGHDETERPSDDDNDDGPLDSILNKYDETSMQQVNDLILSFGKFDISP